MKRCVAYLGIILLTLYVAIMYESKMAAMLLIAEIGMALFLLVTLLYQKRRIVISFLVPEPVIEKDKRCDIIINVNNKSIIPVTMLEFYVLYENKMLKSAQDRFILRGLADGKSSTQFACHLKSTHCGRIGFDIKWMKISSVIPLFTIKLKLKLKETICVLPALYETGILVSEATKTFIIDSDEYDTTKPGDDPSEVFDFREYRMGDKLHRIHWKLSAKTDELMVKEPGLPISCAVLLFLDFSLKENPDQLEALIEAGASYSGGLIREACLHYVSWYSIKEQQIVRRLMNTEEDLYSLLYALLEQEMLPAAETDWTELYHQQFPGETFCSELLINPGLELYLNGEYMDKLRGDRLQESLLELELVL